MPVKKQKLNIDNIPAILWGNTSDKIYIAVHGNQSHKEDTIIAILAEELNKLGIQVLSFDLAGHGDRKNISFEDNVQMYVNDLSSIFNYAKTLSDNINLFAVSIGAYFSLLAFSQKPINQVLFLSPILDMQKLIENMMLWFNVTKEQLQQQKEIQTPIKTLSWCYYTYVCNHPINSWHNNTHILYGSKDNLTDKHTIEDFVQKFNAQLTVIENAEHFFHTQQDISLFREWIINRISPDKT